MRAQSSLLFPACLVLAVLASGCTDAESPMAPSTPELPEVSLSALPPGWFELDFTANDNCNGEMVDFETRRIDRLTVKEDAAGGFHVSLHRTWIGTGVGQVTGTEYNLNWPHQVTNNFRGPFPETFNRYIANNLVSKGSADNRIFSLLQHLTVNANGDVTVDRSDLKLECVG